MNINNVQRDVSNLQENTKQVKRKISQGLTKGTLSRANINDQIKCEKILLKFCSF